MHSPVILSEAKDLAEAGEARGADSSRRHIPLAQARSFAALRMTVFFPSQSIETQENT